MQAQRPASASSQMMGHKSSSPLQAALPAPHTDWPRAVCACLHQHTRLLLSPADSNGSQAGPATPQDRCAPGEYPVAAPSNHTGTSPCCSSARLVQLWQRTPEHVGRHISSLSTLAHSARLGSTRLGLAALCITRLCAGPWLGLLLTPLARLCGQRSWAEGESALVWWVVGPLSWDLALSCCSLHTAWDLCSLGALEGVLASTQPLTSVSSAHVGPAAPAGGVMPSRRVHAGCAESASASPALCCRHLAAAWPRHAALDQQRRRHRRRRVVLGLCGLDLLGVVVAWDVDVPDLAVLLELVAEVLRPVHGRGGDHGVGRAWEGQNTFLDHLP